MFNGMFSEEVINQIRAAKAARAAKQTETDDANTQTDEIDENFDPIRNIDPANADKELHGSRLAWTGW